MVMGTAFILSAPFVGDNNTVMPVAEAKLSVDVDRSSAWYIKEKGVFGAAVSIDGGEYVPIMYKRGAYESGVEKIYRRFSSSEEWQYAGKVVFGAGKDYIFEDPDEVSVFIPVANAAAQSAGFQKMY